MLGTSTSHIQSNNNESMSYKTVCGILCLLMGINRVLYIFEHGGARLIAGIVLGACLISIGIWILIEKSDET